MPGIINIFVVYLPGKARIASCVKMSTGVRNLKPRKSGDAYKEFCFIKQKEEGFQIRKHGIRIKIKTENNK